MPRFYNDGRFSIALLLSLVCVVGAPTARSAEHLDGTLYGSALEQHAHAVGVLERDYLSSIEAASGEQLFDLYRNYNRLAGTWIQVDFLQTLLDLAGGGMLGSDDAARSMLRDHALYVRWELDNAIAGFEANAIDLQFASHLKLNEDSRRLLSSTRITVEQLLVDTCLATCVDDP